MQATTQKCIICTQIKNIEHFNIEHVIPAALGGLIKTKKVCAKCNSELNVSIDEPFVKSHFVLKHRIAYKLNRSSNRTLPNLIKGPVIDNNGNKRFFKTINGELRAIFADKFEHTVHSTGQVECKITLDASKYDDVHSIIEDRLKGLSRVYGQEFKTYNVTNIEKQEHGPTEIIVTQNNNIFIKACVKIAYEFFCEVIQNYESDETAIKLREFLISPDIKEETKELFDFTTLSKYELHCDTFNHLLIQVHQHGIYVHRVENEGVFCAVKIFDYVYSILMSKNPLMWLKEDFLLVNDVIDKKIITNYSVEYSLLNFQVELAGVSEEVANGLMEQKTNYFELSDGSFILFDSKGLIRYDSLKSFCDNLIIKEKIKDNSNTLYFRVDEKQLFLRAKNGLMIKLLSVVVNQKLTGTQLPKPI